MIKRRYWQEHEIEFLREIYPDNPTALIATFFRRSVANVCAAANRHGISKSAAFHASEFSGRLKTGSLVGATGRFQKGLVPHNKGKKMPGYAPGRMRETQFRHGVQSWRTMPIGATRDIEGFLYRKVAEIPNVPYTRNWKLEHRLLWEELNGPVPVGHVLVFRDKNRRNFALDNLELLTMKENSRRNSIHNLPKELVQVIMLRGALKRKLRGINEKQTVRSAQPPVRDARSA